MYAFKFPYLASAGDLILPVDVGQAVKLGWGYDSLNDSFSNATVADGDDKRETIREAGGQTVHTFIDVIEDIYEFKETLRISLSASARGLGGKASAHYSLYRQIQVNTHDVFALIYVTVLNSTRARMNPRLSEAARSEWNNQKPENRKQQMIKTFGDCYISAITEGGEFLSLYRLHTSTRREKERVTASAKASFGAFKASGDFSKVQEVFTSHGRVTSEFSRIGGSGPQPKNDVIELLQAAQQFPEAVDPEKGGRPVPIYFTAQPISKIPDANTNIDLRARKAVEKLEDIARVQGVIVPRLNDARFVAETPELFKGVGAEEAAEIVNSLESASLELSRLADDVIERRFGDLSDINVRKIETLPKPPAADEGTEIPITITVAAFTNPNHLADVEAKAGEWSHFLAMVGLTIKSSGLPEGTFLEYNLRNPKGESGWQQEGTTARSRYMVTGIQIRVSGSNAERYRVRYGIKVQRIAASFYAEDGGIAAMIGWDINALRISLMTI